MNYTTSHPYSWLDDNAYIGLSDAKTMFSTNSATIRQLVKTKNINTHQLTRTTMTYNVGDLRAELSKKNQN